MNTNESSQLKVVPTDVGVENTSGLVGLRPCRDAIFVHPASRPSFRTFCSWRAKNYFEVIVIGRRVFACPDTVRKALEKRFTVPAID